MIVKNNDLASVLEKNGLDEKKVLNCRLFGLFTKEH